MSKPGYLKFAHVTGPFPDSPAYLPFWETRLAESLAWLGRAEDAGEKRRARVQVKEAREALKGAGR